MAALYGLLSSGSSAERTSVRAFMRITSAASSRESPAMSVSHTNASMPSVAPIPKTNRSRRKGNTLGWVVWASMSVMLVCLVLWAATGAVPLLFAAVLAGLRVLYVVLLINR
jgi:hypothetical protein